MAEPQREVLVVLTPDSDPSEVLSRAGGRLTQRVSDRVALADVPAHARQALTKQPEVLAIYDEHVPHLVRQQLDEAERLFVDAWHARAGVKHRVGDGFPWDSPGFDAP